MINFCFAIYCIAAQNNYYISSTLYCLFSSLFIIFFCLKTNNWYQSLFLRSLCVLIFDGSWNKFFLSHSFRLYWEKLWSLGSQNEDLPEGLRSLRSCWRGLWRTFIVRWSYYEPDQNSQGEKKQKRQRQSRVYLSVSLKPFSQESWLSNQQKQFGITWRRNMLEMKEYVACRCLIWWGNLSCKEWKSLRQSRITQTNCSVLPTR